MSADRADRVAAWATGSGIGLVALMLSWLIGSRLTALVWPPPMGPAAALGGAIVIGLATALVSGVRLARRFRQDVVPGQSHRGAVPGGRR